MAKVLLVDDDVDLMTMNRTVLEHRGHVVMCAYSAAEARKAVEKITPDVAVLDVMMESLTSGMDLARELHAKFPKMPMLMLSGVESATGLGFRHSEDESWLPVAKFIDKPLSPEKLAETIEKVTGKKK